MSTFSWVYKYFTFSNPSPLPLKWTEQHFGVPKQGYHATQHLKFIVQLCENLYHWLCIMIYRLQLILYTSKSNLKIYFLCIQSKYVQFHNIKFKMPKSPPLIELETSFKNGQKAQHVNIYYLSKAYIWCYPPPPPSIWFVHLWKCWQVWMAAYTTSRKSLNMLKGNTRLLKVYLLSNCMFVTKWWIKCYIKLNFSSTTHNYGNNIHEVSAKALTY